MFMRFVGMYRYGILYMGEGLHPGYCFEQWVAMGQQIIYSNNSHLKLNSSGIGGIYFMASRGRVIERGSEMIMRRWGVVYHIISW